MHFINTIFVFIFLFFSVQISNGQAAKKPVAKSATSKTQLTVKAKPKDSLTIPKIAATRIKITTDSGVIVIRLYDETPLHRDNFIKLVNNHFYDSLLFHRVIAGFMIQGGDPESKNAVPDQPLGKGDVGYTLPAEFDSTLFHKKGALADYNKAILIDPKDGKSYANRGVVKYDLLDFVGAMADYTKSIELSPENSANYFNRGLLNVELKKMDAACVDFRKALELGDPDAQQSIDDNCK